MHFPLSLPDISLWLAITALVLLITSESLLSQPRSLSFKLDKGRFRLIAIFLGLAFMVSVLLKIIVPSMF